MPNTLESQAVLLRGNIINKVIYIERMVDVYLSCYFGHTQDKKDEIIDLLFAASSGMPFETKRALFALLFQRHKKEYYKENKDFFEYLSLGIKHRNIVAHYLLDESPEAEQRFKDTGDVGFVKFKDVTETVWYSISFIKEIELKLLKASIQATDLAREINDATGQA